MVLHHLFCLFIILLIVADKRKSFMASAKNIFKNIKLDKCNMYFMTSGITYSYICSNWYWHIISTFSLYEKSIFNITASFRIWKLHLILATRVLEMNVDFVKHITLIFCFKINRTIYPDLIRLSHLYFLSSFLR